jgi:hypothetical protein
MLDGSSGNLEIDGAWVRVGDIVAQFGAEFPENAAPIWRRE